MQGLDYNSLVIIGRQKMAEAERKATLRAQLGSPEKKATRLSFLRRHRTATSQPLPLRPTNPGFQL